MLDQNDLQAIAQLIHESETRLCSQLRGEIHESETRLYGEIQKTREEVQDSELRTRTFIENEVNKRIESLFDGYKLTHEKQWELERDNKMLNLRMDVLQERLAKLEKKVSA